MNTQPHLVQGVDHAAFPTFDPKGTVRFYRDVLGFPVAHAICATGWGPSDHPDFIHFFFDIGGGDRVAFFYYFGHARPPEGEQGDAWAALPEGTPVYFARSRHLAIHVPSEADMLEYKRRLDASKWPCEMQVMHETIESIYVHDPNGYFVEITRPTRPLQPSEVTDANLTVDALIEAADHAAPSLAHVLGAKGAALAAQYGAPAHPVALYVLDVEEFAPLARVAEVDPKVSVRKVGPFFEVSSPEAIVIDRRATGCRHAVWYSAVGGLVGGRVAQHDKDALRVEPA